MTQNGDVLAVFVLDKPPRVVEGVLAGKQVKKVKEHD